MIEVVHDKTSLLVSGHALVGRKQATAVCAAVSVLVQLLSRYTPVEYTPDGWFFPLPESGGPSAEVAFVLEGFRLLAASYPRNIRLRGGAT